VSLGGCGTAGHPAQPPRLVPAGQLRQSIARAYAFLDQMTDRYAAGPAPRLVQSFTGGPLGRQHVTASQTYDDALVIDAFLASGTAAGQSKAVAIGDGLLRAQASDPRHDGRLRAAYAPAPPGNPSDAGATNLATLAGNMAWAGLALRDPRYAASVSWDVHNLTVTGRFGGVSSCRGDRSGAWYEGTAHLADALEFRGDPGDRAQAARYLADIYYAQTRGPGADGRGIIAASRNGLTDCGGGTYYTSLHTGTTAWYILAAEKINPFTLIRPAGHR
jgi:hypothetical protein